MSIREALNHAEMNVVQVEQRVESFLKRRDDPSADPVDLQCAARECRREIRVVGSSLITPEFAKYLAGSVLPEPPPDWMVYESFHHRLDNVLFASDLAGKRLTMKSPVQNKPNFPLVSLRISRSRVSELEHLRRLRNASSHASGSRGCLAYDE
jgi:hypothetical protein